jgi:hypothetical protein
MERMTDAERARMAKDMAKKLIADFNDLWKRTLTTLPPDVPLANMILATAAQTIYYTTMVQAYAQCPEAEACDDTAIYKDMGEFARELILGRDEFRVALNDPEKRAKLYAENLGLLSRMR